jgi:hypothetical protein
MSLKCAQSTLVWPGRMQVLIELAFLYRISRKLRNLVLVPYVVASYFHEANASVQWLQLRNRSNSFFHGIELSKAISDQLLWQHAGFNELTAIDFALNVNA